MFLALRSTDRGNTKSAGEARRVLPMVVNGGRASFGEALVYRPADVDDVVGDDSEADPALHSDEALVSAPVEAMSAFDHADASLAVNRRANLTLHRRPILTPEGDESG